MDETGDREDKDDFTLCRCAVRERSLFNTFVCAKVCKVQVVEDRERTVIRLVDACQHLHSPWRLYFGPLTLWISPMSGNMRARTVASLSAQQPVLICITNCVGKMATLLK